MAHFTKMSSHQQINSPVVGLTFFLPLNMSLIRHLFSPTKIKILSNFYKTFSSIFCCTTSNKLKPNKLIRHKTIIRFALCGLFIQLLSKMLFGSIIQMASAQSIKCGDMKQCSGMFRQATLQHNLSYDLTKEKIEEMCVKLNNAVDCFKEYRSSCITDNFYLSQVTANFYDQMSEGPLGLTMELCKNEKFKQDYLTLGPCQKKYRSEFDKCLKLPQIISNSQNDNSFHNDNQNGHHNETILERFIEHCCTLHTYHNCIYDISLEKCGRDAAEFSLKILELFNRAYLRDCVKHANLSHLCIRNHYLASSASSSVSAIKNKVCLFAMFFSASLSSLLFILAEKQLFCLINANLNFKNFCQIINVLLLIFNIILLPNYLNLSLSHLF